jgi:hypothetical protein
MTSRNQAMPGDVVVRRNPAANRPAFVLRAEPGPDQCGCGTLASAAQIAKLFARHAGVDMWMEDAAGSLSVIARFRASAHRPRPVASCSAGSVQRASGAAS